MAVAVGCRHLFRTCDRLAFCTYSQVARVSNACLKLHCEAVQLNILTAYAVTHQVYTPYMHHWRAALQACTFHVASASVPVLLHPYGMGGDNLEEHAATLLMPI